MKIHIKAMIPGAVLSGLASLASPVVSAKPLVPAPAQCYVDAVNSGKLDALAACFDQQAVIRDVNRNISGQAAIRAWAMNEVMGGELRVLDSQPRDGGVRLLVHWAPKGETGWNAWYDFQYRGSKLTRADLQYA